MESKFLMENNSWLRESPNRRGNETAISEALHRRLMKTAIGRACEFYADFFRLSPDRFDPDRLVSRYLDDEQEAQSLGLCGPGGILAKNHLSLWCLGVVLQPKFYIESGVFTGSSLHAMATSCRMDRIVAIDPDLSRLRLSPGSESKIELVDDLDFSQLELSSIGDPSLAYFDDHVDSAARILQSAEKGLRYVLFDDSNGLEGICQRVYPAIPTVPMILLGNTFQVGDRLSWSVDQPLSASIKKAIKGLLRGQRTPLQRRFTLEFTEELLEHCEHARSHIRRCVRLPDLGELVPQQRPGPSIDGSKYLIELA